MPSTSINPEKVVKKINAIFLELKSGIDPKKLSSEDKKEILNELDALEKLALSIKAKISDNK